MCRMCGERDETISHIVSECKKLAQNDYKKWRHDKVAAVIHWHLCHKFGFPCGSKNYEHFVDIFFIYSLKVTMHKYKLRYLQIYFTILLGRYPEEQKTMTTLGP